MRGRTTVSLSSVLFMSLAAAAVAAVVPEDDLTTIWITGQVVLDDGYPPLGPIRVALVCGGRVFQETVTSANGAFFFQISAEPQLQVLDRAESSDKCLMNEMDLSDCHVRLTGNAAHGAEPIRLGRRSPLDNPEVGTIVIRQAGNAMGATVDLDALLIPESARRSLDRAARELSQPSPSYPKAARALEKAVELFPKLAVAWQLLGEVRGRIGDPLGARKAFENAIVADSSYCRAYLSLARLDLYDEKWKDAARLTQTVMQMNKVSPQALYFNGIANYYLGRATESEQAFVQLKETGFAGIYPVALFHLGMIRAQQGRYDLAAADFKLYLQLMPRELMPKGQYEWLEGRLEGLEAAK